MLRVTMRRVKSVEEKLVAVRQRYAQRTGRSVTVHSKSAPADNETIEFGTADGCPVRLPIAGLTKHLHCVGTTSAGKSNFLEIIIRQLISKGYAKQTKRTGGTRGAAQLAWLRICRARSGHQSGGLGSQESNGRQERRML